MSRSGLGSGLGSNVRVGSRVECWGWILFQKLEFELDVGVASRSCVLDRGRCLG